MSSRFQLLEVEDSGRDSDPEDVSDSSAIVPADTPWDQLSKKQRARRRAQERKASAKLPVPASSASTKEQPSTNGRPASPAPSFAEVVKDDTKSDESAASKPATKAQEEIPAAPKEKKSYGQVTMPLQEKVSNALPAVSLPSIKEPASALKQAANKLGDSLQASKTSTAVSTPFSSQPISETGDGESEFSADEEANAAAEPQSKVINKATKDVAQSTDLTHGADHAPSKKRQSIITRTITTLLMILGFIGILLLGHGYVVVLILFLQASVFKELVGLFDVGWRSMTHQRRSSNAKKREESDAYSKTLSWYFFTASNYYLYGESIIFTSSTSFWWTRTSLPLPNITASSLSCSGLLASCLSSPLSSESLSPDSSPCSAGFI